MMMISDPVTQVNHEERLMFYNEFHKPEAVRSRDDLSDLDSSRVTNLTIRDSVAYHDDEEEGGDDEEDEEEAAQDCHLVHSVQVYSDVTLFVSQLFYLVFVFVRQI